MPLKIRIIIIHSITAIWLIINSYNTAFSQRVKKVANINKAVVASFSPTDTDPSNVKTASLANCFLFTLNNKRFGEELWRSDGTDAGTYMVKDLYPGPKSSLPNQFLVLNNILYFTVKTDKGLSLCRSDGSESGTFILKTFDDNEVSGIWNLTGGINKFCFTVNFRDGSIELWKSDGSESGTLTIEKNLPFGTSSTGFGSLYFFKERLYYTKYLDSGKFQIYSTDEVPGNSIMLKEWTFLSSFHRTVSFFSLANELYFASQVETLKGIWKIDSDNGTVLNITNQDVYTSRNPIQLQDNFYFFDSHSLWKTNGTYDGTIKIKTFDRSLDEEYPFLEKTSNYLYFKYKNSSSQGKELWRTDGTLAGTIMVKDINPGYRTSNISFPTVLDNHLFFTVSTSESGREIWRSDGTDAGTNLLFETLPGSNSLVPHALFVFKSKLHFFDKQLRVWTSSGTENSTKLSLVNEPLNIASNPNNWISFKGNTFFTATNGISDYYGLWRTNGLEDGTILVNDWTCNCPLSKNNNYLFFLSESTIKSYDGINFRDIWHYGNGNARGAKFLSTSIPDKVIFSAFDDSHFNKLYRSDGSTGSTVLIKDLYPNEEIYFENPVEHNGIVYFTTRDKTELWKTDGTYEGTLLLKDSLKIEDPLISSNGVLYFSSIFRNNGKQDHELWKTDGTAQGTVIVYDSPEYNQTKSNLIAIGNLVYYINWEIPLYQLYRSDGTPKGTFKINLPLDQKINPYGTLIVPLNGSLILNTYSDSGYEVVNQLYRLDTLDNTFTKIEMETRGDINISQISNFFQFENSVYFSASIPNIKEGLWKTNGITASFVQNISEHESGLHPGNFFNADGVLFFTANDRQNGYELYKLSNCMEEQNLNLIDTVLPGHIKEISAKDFLYSSSILNNNTAVIYESGKSITLNPGFVTEGNAYFQAIISPCE